MIYICLIKYNELYYMYLYIYIFMYIHVILPCIHINIFVYLCTFICFFINTYDITISYVHGTNTVLRLYWIIPFGHKISLSAKKDT